MKLWMIVFINILLVTNLALSQAKAECPPGVDRYVSRSLNKTVRGNQQPIHEPGSCHFRYAADGSTLPDPSCTPGAINPTVAVEVLRDPSFRTSCIRDKITSEKAKHIVYLWYGVQDPINNRGQDQTCELDHLIDLYDGGSDALENIWPQCDFRSVSLNERSFKVKDGVELATGHLIRSGADPVPIQRQIADDWTQLK
jgi:hypothetical protein